MQNWWGVVVAVVGEGGVCGSEEQQLNWEDSKSCLNTTILEQQGLKKKTYRYIETKSSWSWSLAAAD